MGASTPVYLGSGVPVPQRAGQQTAAGGGASSNGPSNGSTAGVKKWKNKLKTLLGAPSSQSPSTAASAVIITPSPPAPSSASLSVSNSNNTSSSTATPRPSSPHETLHAAYHTSSSSSLSLPMSHSSSSSSAHSKQASPANSNAFTAITTATRASTSTPVPSALLNSLSKSSLNDVYAGYDISVDYPSNHHNNNGDLTISGGGDDEADTRANDSYEARLSRLVGDLENVDYSSFTSFTNSNAHNASFGQLMAAHSDSADASGDNSRNIAISSALFKDGNGNAYGDLSYNLNNQPFTYVSAGTPSALNISSGMGGAKSNNNILSSSFLNSAFFRSSPEPSGSNDTNLSNNNDINIDDVLASFMNNNTPNLSSNNNPSSHHHPSQTSLFTDYFEDDDIRIPSYDFADARTGTPSTKVLDHQHVEGAPTPSSSSSAPLSAVHSTTSNASGKSTAATSIYMTENGSMGRRRTRSDAASNGMGGKPFEGFYPADKSLIALPFGTPAASSDMASSATQCADGLTARAFANGASTSSDDDDDDFSNLLRQSQIDAGTIDYAAGNTTSTASEETTKAADGNEGNDESLDMTGNQTLTLPSDSTSSLDFDLKLFPLPGSAETTQQKQANQQTPLQIKTTSVLMNTNFSSVSDQSSGPSPSLSYGGSSTSNTSFDDLNAPHGLVAAAATAAPRPSTPRKGKQGGSGNRNSKNLAVSIAGVNDENVLPSSSVSLTSFATPTQSPHGSLSSCPPTPASYKTASSLPTSPYRPRPIVHAASLAWRVPPSTMSPKSSIAIDASRSLRPSPSQSFINSDPFATPASPTRLSKLNTASSPELKRRRNIRDDRDEDDEGEDAPTGIEGRMASTQDDLALNAGQSVQANGQARPIAGRRRVAGKIVPSNMQLPQFSSNAHERRFSQPAPSVNTKTPYYSTQPLSIGQDYGMRARQLTAPLPSPAPAAYQYQQQQQQHQQYIAPSAVPQQQQQQPGAVSWLSDDIVSSLFSKLSDQNYLCLMQNCGQRFSNYDAVQAHIQAHFAPQPQPVAVPMHHGQSMYTRQQSGPISHSSSGPAQPQYQMYPQQGMPRPHVQQQTVWS